MIVHFTDCINVYVFPRSMCLVLITSSPWSDVVWAPLRFGRVAGGGGVVVVGAEGALFAVDIE